MLIYVVIDICVSKDIVPRKGNLQIPVKVKNTKNEIELSNCFSIGLEGGAI